MIDPYTGSFAFAAWGGLFYIFYAYGDSASTTVYRVTPQGEVTTFLPDTGLDIVGAGVAVCY
jgi:hypothetical protein